MRSGRSHLRWGFPRAWLLAATLLITAAVGACAAPGAGAQTASWQFTPVNAPAPTTGGTPAPYPIPLGQIGQISFWAPNRGLLITGGTTNSGGVVPAGVWAYDGVSWHELSSVCGGADGRIAWAGPDEFWTISDQRPTSSTSTTGSLQSISLCHFDDGQVVASYAEPLGQANSYSVMDAAACDGPDDCWFGGADTTTADPGAFQLHWDGTNLTETQEPEDHAVNDMSDYQGQIYESVRFAATDDYLPTENQRHPAVFHQIEGSSFVDTYTFDAGSLLPIYGTGVSPDALTGFALSTDGGGGLESGATQLWAAANPVQSTPSGSQSGSLTILRHIEEGWTQVAPWTGPTSGAACAQPLTLPGTAGQIAKITAQTQNPDGSIAAMPGTDDAWLSLVDPGQGVAESAVALIDPNGCVLQHDSPESSTPSFTQAADQSSAPGATGTIDCPAQNDCWMATANGWLYNYTDGTTYPQDTDPNFAGIITVRPADDATPTVYSDIPPVDDSGTATTYTATYGTAKSSGRTSTRLTVRLTHVTSKLVHKTELVLAFDLNIRARVQLLAQRRGKVVARSARRVLAPGRRSLTLKLDLKRWPTHIKVDAAPESGTSGKR